MAGRGWGCDIRKGGGRGAQRARTGGDRDRKGSSDRCSEGSRADGMRAAATRCPHQHTLPATPAAPFCPHPCMPPLRCNVGGAWGGASTAKPCSSDACEPLVSGAAGGPATLPARIGGGWFERRGGSAGMAGECALVGCVYKSAGGVCGVSGPYAPCGMQGQPSSHAHMARAPFAAKAAELLTDACSATWRCARRPALFLPSTSAACMRPASRMR